jgi:hypothetical protein
MMILVTRIMACHVLWRFGLGTVAERARPGDFVGALLEGILHADPSNLALLARSFPGYVHLVRELRADEDGTFLEEVRATARGEVLPAVDVESPAEREQRFAEGAYREMLTSTVEGLPAPVDGDNPYRAALSRLVTAVDRAAVGTYTPGEAQAIRRGLARALVERGWRV